MRPRQIAVRTVREPAETAFAIIGLKIREIVQLNVLMTLIGGDFLWMIIVANLNIALAGYMVQVLPDIPIYSFLDIATRYMDMWMWK